MNIFHTDIKYGGYMYTQTAFNFKISLEVITRNDIFQKKFLLHNKRAMAPQPHPKVFVTIGKKDAHPPPLRRYVIIEWTLW